MRRRRKPRASALPLSAMATKRDIAPAEVPREIFYRVNLLVGRLGAEAVPRGAGSSVPAQS